MPLLLQDHGSCLGLTSASIVPSCPASTHNKLVHRRSTACLLSRGKRVVPCGWEVRDSIPFYSSSLCLFCAVIILDICRSGMAAAKQVMISEAACPPTYCTTSFAASLPMAPWTFITWSARVSGQPAVDLDPLCEFTVHVELV